MMFASAVLILLFFSNSNHAINASAQSDKQLLLELRNSLKYDSSFSTKLVHWNESSDFCHWPGLKCDSKSRVSVLDLSDEPISDGINDSNSTLFKLVTLQTLSLAQTSFESVEFPSGFGQLSELRHLNLSNSKFSGQVPSDFSNLTRLVVLDLTTSTRVSLELTNLSGMIREYSNLREMYLDWVNMSANGKEWSSAISSFLPNLSVLSLSNSYLTGPIASSLLKLRSLSVIRLDGNPLSSPFPHFFADFSNLSVLTMSGCNISGVLPAKLFHVKGLQTIDLRNNVDLQGSLPEFTVNDSLQSLLLRGTNLSGNVSESIGNLKMLSNLDLGYCNFSGPVPRSFRNLSHLVSLDISWNHFSGSVPSFALLKNLRQINLAGNRLSGPIPESLWEGLENLDAVDLSENLLQGEVPESLFALPLLRDLDLSRNLFSGWNWSSTTTVTSSLLSIDLRFNRIEGPFPRILFKQPSLLSLYLTGNKLNGSLHLTDFGRMDNLSSLELSYNDLSVHVDENVSLSLLFPRLQTLNLASCKLQKIPLMMNHSSLTMLDLSDTELEGEIPNWLWGVSDGYLRHLNLSRNRFTHLQQPYDLRRVQYLDLHSNSLVGQIPLPLPIDGFIDLSRNNLSSPLPPDIGISFRTVIFFSVAGNKITGSVPSSLCNASSYLQVLDLSDNSFNGGIPSCLLESTTLSVLNLRRNNLDGDIPDTFPDGCRLQTLDLSRNALQGKVPISLARCAQMEVLNLGNNVLNDTIPCWLRNFSRLQVLELRSNNFHGNIDCLGDTTTWPKLQIISLASNNISGVIPANMFRNLPSFMVTDRQQQQLDHLYFFLAINNIYYQDSITVALKGQGLELEKILTIFTSIDFSDNNLYGSIPQTIGELRPVYVLNFSHNALSGHIPSSVGNLQQLGSFDLSFNDLDGTIPTQLATLTFLSFLNLSYNHLEGRIPPGSQMQTFGESSFVGNNDLCGIPLTKTCNDSRTSPAFPEGDNEADSVRWEIVGAALGFVVGLGFLFGPLMYSQKWRRWYNIHVNRIVLLVFRRKGRS